MLVRLLIDWDAIDAGIAFLSLIRSGQDVRIFTLKSLVDVAHAMVTKHTRCVEVTVTSTVDGDQPLSLGVTAAG